MSCISETFVRTNRIPGPVFPDIQKTALTGRGFLLKRKFMKKVCPDSQVSLTTPFFRITLAYSAVSPVAMQA